MQETASVSITLTVICSHLRELIRPSTQKPSDNPEVYVTKWKAVFYFIASFLIKVTNNTSNA